MKAHELKTIKSAIFLRGYFFGKELPEEVRLHLDHLCNEIENILTDVNQIVEADTLREEMERMRKRAEREAKKPPVHHQVECREQQVSIANEQVTMEVPAHAIEPAQAPEAPAKKEKAEWTPEKRAAQAERMRAMHAKKKESGKLADAIIETSKSAPDHSSVPTKTYSVIPPEKLIERHNEYIGKRDAEQDLTDTDWPDVNDMLTRQGVTLRAIAQAYDVTFEVMRTFIDRKQAEQRRNA